MKPPCLRLSKSFVLPTTFITSTHGILGQKGSGKSHEASVIAEEMLRSHQQTVILDPTGAWFGLRTNADGKRPGFPIPVFGGEHGDIGLLPDSGEVLARAIATEHFSAVVDLSVLRKGQANRFVGDFLETLYRLNRVALHLVVDEADLYAPQRPFGDEARTLGAMEDIVRRGRIKGIGITMITQRPQVISKNVLSQVDMLSCFRMNHPKDLAAVREWVAVHGDDAQAKRMLADLPTLPTGEAWIWNPQADVFQRVKIRHRETYDSGRTPKAGERIAMPKVLAKVEIEALGAAMAETAARAKENDPKALKARVAELTKQLADSKATTTKEKIVHKIKEVPMLKAAHLAQLKAASSAMDRASAPLMSAIDRLVAATKDISMAIAKATERPAAATVGSTPVHRETVRPIGRIAPAPMPTPAPAPRDTSRRTAAAGDGSLTRMARSMLIALAQHPDGLTKRKLRVHTGYANSGPVSTTFAQLIADGLAEDATQGLRITKVGLAKLGAFEPLPVGDDLRVSLLNGTKLSQMERKILAVICDVYPDTIDKASIREKSGYANSGPVSTAFAHLVALDYVTTVGRGLLAATELFG